MAVDPTTDELVYFASLDSDHLAEELEALVEKIIDDNNALGWYDLLRRSYRTYYGFDMYGGGHASSEVFAAGRQGELTKAKINHFRNLIKHVLVMATSERPAFEPKATNNSPDSIEQTVIARGILEYYLRTKKLEQKLSLAAEASLIYGEGFLALDWDPRAGMPYVSGDEGDTTHEGDVVANVYTPFNVFKEEYQQTDENTWIIVRDWVNRFELIAQYPELRGELLTAPNKEEVLAQQFGDMGSMWNRRDSDLVPVYKFYHKRTPAVPNGRVCSYVTKDAVLYDAPLPYREVPVFRISPGEMLETNKGYTTAFDTLSIQTILDTLHSTILSNQVATGVQLIWTPEGVDLDYRHLAEGLSVISTPPNMKPESIQLTSTAKEIFSYLDIIEKQGEVLWGVSSVNRGDPEKHLRTGSALALVQAMSIQFNDAFQRSWAHLLENVGTTLIHLLQDYAKTERVADIVGYNKSAYLKAFTGDTVRDVELVTVRVGSPLQNQAAGKVQMADTMLERGLINRPDEYIQVVETGRLDPAIDSLQSQKLLIERENEVLSKGETTPVMPLDAHHIHIQDHMDVLKDPRVRQDPALVQAVMAHIQEHNDKWTQISQQQPNLLLALNIPLAVQPPPEVAPAAQAQQAAQGAGSQAGSAQMANVLKGDRGGANGTSPADLPVPPADPTTGQPMDIPLPNAGPQPT